MRPFKYLEPNTIEEVTGLLGQYTREAMIYAGGTSLVPMLKKSAITPKYLVNPCKLSDLDFIHVGEKDGLRIGSLTSIRAVEKSNELRGKFEMISKTAAQIGGIAVRNVATVGGNLCNASPWSDMTPILTALSAQIKLISSSGIRMLSLDNTLPGFGGVIPRPDEILAEIQVPIVSSQTRGIYLKCTTKGGNSPCLAGVAVVGSLNAEKEIFNEAKIVIGGVQASVIRAYEAEDYLKEKRIDEALIERVATIASNEAQPKESIHGSADYRKEMVKIYTRNAIKHSVELYQKSI